MTADQLIARYDLAPHPEGGWYRRIYTSVLPVTAGQRQRPAVTSILYLLRAGEVSRWHRVRSDELWHFYGGAPLVLLCADAACETLRTLQLGPPPGELPMQPIAAGCWQAARCLGGAADYSLVGCSVAPGFTFDDFALLADVPDAAAQLRARWPQHGDLL
jgi:predicted cupin superfamily sugar epimerase